MYEVTIYTDGACSGNPGAGGWSAILLCKGQSKQISGGENNTTNNQMELKAALYALRALKRSSKVTIYSDSAYLVNAFKQGWIANWMKSGWKTSSKKPVQNKEIWLALLQAIKPHDVTFVKVKGHANNQYNNECDRLAKEAITKIEKR